MSKLTNFILRVWSLAAKTTTSSTLRNSSCSILYVASFRLRSLIAKTKAVSIGCKTLVFILHSLVFILNSSFCLLVQPQSITAQVEGKPPDIAEYGYPTFRTYTDRDGLPQNTINQVTTDRKGYLWIGTQNGAAFFNGHRWTVINMQGGTLSNRVRSLLQAADGSYWFGTEDSGLLRKDGDNWMAFSRLSGALLSDEVKCMVETVTPTTAKSTLWVGTSAGLSCFENGKWTHFTAEDGTLPNNRVMCLLQTTGTNGSPVVWAGTEGGGLVKFEDGAWTRLDTSAIASNAVLSLMATISPKTQEQTLWVGTSGGLARVEQGRWTLYDINTGLPSNVVLSLLETRLPDGTPTVWVGTYGGGLARFEQDRWITFNTKNSTLPNNGVRSLIETRSETGTRLLWVGTYGGGLARFEQSQWIGFDTKTGLPNDLVYSFLESKNPTGDYGLWLGTGAGLVYYLKGEIETYTIAPGKLNSDVIYSLLETRTPEGVPILWVGTYGGGLSRFDGKNWQTFIAPDLPSNIIYCLYETRTPAGNSVLWVGTDNGLARLEDGVWQTFQMDAGLPDNVIYGLFQTTSTTGISTLWVATRNGLAAFQNGQWTSFGSETGLPKTAMYSFLETSAPGQQPQLWIGTGGAGVYTLDLTGWYGADSLKMVRPLPVEIRGTVFRMLATQKGAVYLTTNTGVVRLEPATTGSGGGPTYQLQRTFTNQDGLPSVECLRGAALIDHRGRIWAGTAAGAALFDPTKELKDSSLKPLMIERITVNGQALEYSKGPVVLAYDQDNVVFEYALLSYFRETDTTFQVQLIGYDKKPTAWTTDAKKEYTNLEPNRYTFQVWGKDYAGNVSGPVSFSFEIKPAPWNTWYAYVFYLFVIIGGMYLAVQTRIKTLQNRAEALERAVQERTAEVVRQKDELSAQNIEIIRQRDEITEKNHELELRSQEIQEKNTKIIDSILYAERIQQATLPYRERIDQSLREYFILFYPKDIVSGDFYWFHYADGISIIACADCTGHGVPGAFMSMIGNNLLNQIVIENRIHDPALILETMHGGIRRALKQDSAETESQDGMDVALCRIERETGLVVFAGAKRPLYLIDEQGEFIEIKGDTKSIGGKQKEARRTFTNHEIQIGKGVTLYMATDGYGDQSGEVSPKFGTRRFKEFLKSISYLSMEDQYVALIHELKNHQGAEPQRDDITVIGIRIPGKKRKASELVKERT